MQSRLGRVVLLFIPVFTVSFLAADYFWTGTVTNTWIGIGLISAAITSIIRISFPVRTGTTEGS